MTDDRHEYASNFWSGAYEKYIAEKEQKSDEVAKEITLTGKGKAYYSYEDSESTLNFKKEKKPGIFSKVNKKELFKHVGSMVASGCATIVISRYLKANMPESQNMFEKAVTGVGLYFITGVVGSKVAEYTENEIDSLYDTLVRNDETEGE